MKCIECKNCDLQKVKEMSKLGWGFCNVTVATFYPLVKEFECKQYAKAKDELIAKRYQWYKTRINTYEVT